MNLVELIFDYFLRGSSMKEVRISFSQPFPVDEDFIKRLAYLYDNSGYFVHNDGSVDWYIHDEKKGFMIEISLPPNKYAINRIHMWRLER